MDSRYSEIAKLLFEEDSESSSDDVEVLDYLESKLAVLEEHSKGGKYVALGIPRKVEGFEFKHIVAFDAIEHSRSSGGRKNGWSAPIQRQYFIDYRKRQKASSYDNEALVVDCVRTYVPKTTWVLLCWSEEKGGFELPVSQATPKRKPKCTPSTWAIATAAIKSIYKRLAAKVQKAIGCRSLRHVSSAQCPAGHELIQTKPASGTCITCDICHEQGIHICSLFTHLYTFSITEFRNYNSLTRIQHMLCNICYVCVRLLFSGCNSRLRYLWIWRLPRLQSQSKQ